MEKNRNVSKLNLFEYHIIFAQVMGRIVNWLGRMISLLPRTNYYVIYLNGCTANLITFTFPHSHIFKDGFEYESSRGLIRTKVRKSQTAQAINALLQLQQYIQSLQRSQSLISHVPESNHLGNLKHLLFLFFLSFCGIYLFLREHCQLRAFSANEHFVYSSYRDLFSLIWPFVLM